MIKTIIGILLSSIMILSADFDTNTYISGQIKAKGQSAPNQNQYSARRAAILDAQRNLLEIIGGLKLISKSSMNKGILQDDKVQSHLVGFLKGAIVLEETYDRSRGLATVTIGIGYLDSVSKALGIAKGTGALQEELYGNKEPEYYEPPAQKKVQNPYDALIVDVRGLDFEPAAINRIYFNEKLIYDPIMVPRKIISDKGLAKYVTSSRKANHIIKSFNATNPLTIKATSLSRLNSDVKISQEDAQIISSHNIAKGFLEKANIIFIVD